MKTHDQPRVRRPRALFWLALTAANAGVAVAGLAVWYQLIAPGHPLYGGPPSAPRWYNPIPGYPDSIPEALVVKKGPWPLPAGQNAGAAIDVRIDPEHGVTLKGMPNPCRYWSFTFYGSKDHSGGLPSISSREVELEADGSFVITFSPRPAAKNWVDTGAATRGGIGMRVYVPLSGHRIRMPAVYFGDELAVPAREKPYEE